LHDRLVEEVMTISAERLRANAWGPYYVTGECNACGVCAACAPDNIGRAWDGTYFAVAFQPHYAREEQEMKDAMSACPLGCLRDDGDL
jgi:ferredoxin